MLAKTIPARPAVDAYAIVLLDCGVEKNGYYGYTSLAKAREDAEIRNADGWNVNRGRWYVLNTRTDRLA